MTPNTERKLSEFLPNWLCSLIQTDGSRDRVLTHQIRIRRSRQIRIRRRFAQKKSARGDLHSFLVERSERPDLKYFNIYRLPQTEEFLRGRTMASSCSASSPPMLVVSRYGPASSQELGRAGGRHADTVCPVLDVRLAHLLCLLCSVVVWTLLCLARVQVVS